MSKDFAPALKGSGLLLIVVWVIVKLELFTLDADGNISRFARFIDALIGTVSDSTLMIGLVLFVVGYALNRGNSNRNAKDDHIENE